MASGPTSVRSCNSAEAGADIELTKSAVRSPLCGWLLKRKSNNSRSRYVCGSNRRYVTFDFGAQVFYYAHSEAKKSVSIPTSFHDLLGVESLLNNEGLTEDHGESPPQTIQRTTSKGSIASAFKMPKISSLGALKRSTVQHGFALRTTTKTTEFFCASESEAEMWIEAIKEAIVLGNGANKQNKNDDEASRVELSTTSGSSTRTLPSPRSAEEALVTDAAPVSACENLCADPTCKNAFVDPMHENSCEGSVETPSKLEVSMAVTALDTMEALSQDRCNDAWACHADGTDEQTTSKTVPRYSDKAEGLSLSERLQQLEFSDDEDEDEDGTLASFSRRPPTIPPTIAPPPLPSQDDNGAITIDACQSFRQEQDSDDD